MTIRLLAFAVLFPIISFAQTDTVFLRNDMISTRANADSYRPTPVLEGNKYKITEYFLSNNKIAVEAYSYSLDSIIFDGYYISYYANGRKREFGNYLKGNKVGQWKLKYEDTDRVWAVINYFAGERDTTEELISFYKSGKIKRKEWSVKDKDTGVCFSETGENIPYTPFAVMPEFNGEMNRYLAQTIRYPDEAREAGIGGKILVDFFVHEDGTIETLKTHGHDVSLCKEAIRAIKAMPKWKPGKVDDKPVKVSFTQPVVFKLE